MAGYGVGYVAGYAEACPPPTPTPRPTATPRPTPTPTITPQAIKDQLAQLANRARKENGVGQLTYSRDLERTAQAHADWMLEADCYKHVFDGCGAQSAAVPLVDALGCAWGENLAKDGVDANDVFVGYDRPVTEAFLTLVVMGDGTSGSGWMESPGHRANLLRPTYTHHGFGISGLATDEPTYVVHHFCER